MFILASSVFKCLQCLISALTQGGEGGHSFRLTCSAVLWGWRDTTNTTDTCWECLQWMDHTGFTRAQGSVCFLELPAQSPGCFARALSQVSPAFHAHPRSKMLRFLGVLQEHRPRWAVSFVPFPGPGPSHSGDQVLGKCTVPGGPCILCTSLVLATQFPGMRAQFYVCCVSPLGADLRL